MSPNGITIALGTKSGTIHLWNIRTGGCHSFWLPKNDSISATRFSPINSLHSFQLPENDSILGIRSSRINPLHSSQLPENDSILAIRFSSINPRRFTSLSKNGTVQQWDIDGHRIGKSYRDTHEATNLIYSSDGTRFVSSGGKVATVRDSEDGTLVAQLRTPDHKDIYKSCFSPDRRFVAGIAWRSIYIWDITVPEGRLVRRLDGHSDSIRFITFSSSLISVSEDQSLKFWQASDFLGDSTTTNQVATLPGSTQIESVKLYAKDGTFVTSDSPGVVEIWDLATGRSKSSFTTQTPAGGTRDTHLAGDTLIIVWGSCADKEVHIWDVYNSQPLRNITFSPSSSSYIKISGDGSKLFVSGNSAITGEIVGCADLKEGDPDLFNTSQICVRGSKVGIGRYHAGWDFGDPKKPRLETFPDQPRLGFVHSKTGHWKETRWIEDTETKRRVFCLPTRYAGVDSRAKVEWDGRYLVLLSPSGEMMIIDFDETYPLS